MKVKKAVSGGGPIRTLDSTFGLVLGYVFQGHDSACKCILSVARTKHEDSRRAQGAVVREAGSPSQPGIAAEYDDRNQC